MRPIVKEAEKTFEQYTETIEEDGYTYREKSDAVMKHPYIHSDRFIGEYPHEIELADHYNNDISKAYSEVTKPDTGGDSGSLSEDERTALETIASWEHENRPLKFDHKGVNHKNIPLTRAWTELQKIHGKGLLKITYSSSNKPNEYDLTDEGWKTSNQNEPEVQEVVDQDS